MKQTLIVLLLIAALLAACGPAPTPAPTVDINATLNAMSGTMIAGTLTAQPTATTPPTATPLPPSATPTLPLPTDTPGVFVPTAAPTAVATGQPFIGCFVPTGTTSLTAPFKLENLTTKTVSVFINGTTREGDHTISCSYDLPKYGSVIFTLWWGNYKYWVEVPGRGTFDGSFWINDVDKATMRINLKGIQIGPFT